MICPKYFAKNNTKNSFEYLLETFAAGLSSHTKFDINCVLNHYQPIILYAVNGQLKSFQVNINNFHNQLLQKVYCHFGHINNSFDRADPSFVVRTKA